MNELEALQTAANRVGLEVYQRQYDDKRKKPRYYCSLNGGTISPTLDYMNLQHFILGYIQAIKTINQQKGGKAT